MNTSGKPVESQFLRRIPTYGEEPQVGSIQFNDPNYRAVGDKLGGRSVLNARIKELMQALDTERKRSARWKKVAQKFYAISQAWREINNDKLNQGGVK